MCGQEYNFVTRANSTLLHHYYNNIANTINMHHILTLTPHGNTRASILHSTLAHTCGLNFATLRILTCNSLASNRLLGHLASRGFLMVSALLALPRIRSL